MAFLLAMLLFSLAGIPPLAGFFAKFYVFLAAIHAGLYALAVIGVLLSVVGAYYYLRIVKLMYFDAPAERFEPMQAPLAAVLGVSGVFILLYFVYPAPLVAFAGGRSKVIVLNELLFIAIAQNAERSPPGPAGDGRFDQCRGEAPRQGGRAGSALDLVGPAIARPRPRRPRMGLPARQSVREPA